MPSTSTSHGPSAEAMAISGVRVGRRAVGRAVRLHLRAGVPDGAQAARAPGGVRAGEGGGHRARRCGIGGRRDGLFGVADERRTRLDAVVLVHEHQPGLGVVELVLVHHRERRDDHQVAHGGAARGRAVERDDAAAARGAQRVGDQALAVVHVPDVHLFVLAQVGGVQQVFVDGARALVVELAVGDAGAVDLGFEQGAEHRRAARPESRAPVGRKSRDFARLLRLDGFGPAGQGLSPGAASAGMRRDFGLFSRSSFRPRPATCRHTHPLPAFRIRLLHGRPRLRRPQPPRLSEEDSQGAAGRQCPALAGPGPFRRHGPGRRAAVHRDAVADAAIRSACWPTA